MIESIKLLKSEIKLFIDEFRKSDRKIVILLISIAVIQTFSWYFTSRRFFRENLFEIFAQYSDPFLGEYLYWFIGDFVTFSLPAFLIIKFFFHEKLSDYGIKTGDWKTGIKLSGLFLLIMILIVWFISASEQFSLKYPHLSSTRDSFSIFLVYEAGMLVYMIGWEFLWRGFMLFGLEKRFGFYSIFIQMIPFVILHNGKPFIETLGAIPGGIALGWLALRTRSIYYCIAVHIGVMYAIDFLSVLRYKLGEYGIGLQSLFNIIEKII